MQTIIATFDEIARRAPGSERDAIQSLLTTIKDLDAGARATIRMGTISDADVALVGEAYDRATKAVDAAFHDLGSRQLALIATMPETVMPLYPMVSPVTLTGAIRSAENTVTHLIRNHGEGFEAWQGDRMLGRVEAHGIGTSNGMLVIDGAGEWNLDDIEAMGDEDGMAFLLKDGTLVELRKLD